MGSFEAAGTGGELADRDCCGVVNIKRAGIKAFGGVDKAAEFALGHVALADFVAGSL